MTGECSSASLAGSRPVVYQLSTISAGKSALLTWMSEFKLIKNTLSRHRVIYTSGTGKKLVGSPQFTSRFLSLLIAK